MQRWLLMLLAIPALVLADNHGKHNADSKEALSEAYVMPVWVDAVTQVCPWKSEDAEGYIRLIRKQNEDGSHGLFVQWLRKGIAGAPTAAVSTLAVEPLEHDYLVRIEMPSVRSTPERYKLMSSSIMELSSNPNVRLAW